MHETPSPKAQLDTAIDKLDRIERALKITEDDPYSPSAQSKALKKIKRVIRE